MSQDLREFLTKARGLAATARVVPLDQLDPHAAAKAQRAIEPWGLTALRGRLVELSARGATATLTMVTELVFEAQAEAEPVAWIVPWGVDGTTFYPPDVADRGIDLAAVVVVRAASVLIAARAAERLLRSGAFGLIVLDLSNASTIARTSLPDHVQGRLMTLAQAHDAAVVCLTEKPAEATSLGSLVSLRVEALRTRTRDDFEVTLRAIKDKRRGPGWSRVRKVRGLVGL